MKKPLYTLLLAMFAGEVVSGFKAVKARRNRYYPFANPAMEFIPGTLHVHDGPVKLCRSGFHGCQHVHECLAWYDLRDPAVRVFPAEFGGEIQTGIGKLVASSVRLAPKPLSASDIRAAMDKHMFASIYWREMEQQ